MRLMFHVKHDLGWTADTSGYKSHEYGWLAAKERRELHAAMAAVR